MTITSVYAGVTEADVATLTAGGITYRCFVWRSGAERIEAAVMVDGEDGQLVQIDKSIVAFAVDDAVDCPRVLAVEASSLFVVHWIDVDTTPGLGPTGASLYRAIFDVADIAGGWSNQGSVALHETCQYDHATIEGDQNNEFVVCRRTAADTIVTTRYEAPFSWLNVTWTDTRAALTLADTVLACHANSTDDVVLISYQDTLLLRTMRIPASSGGGLLTSSETFPDVLDGDLRFTAVSHVRVAQHQYLVAAEAIPETSHSAGASYYRLVCWRLINSTTTSGLYRSHWLKNIHLESRLWTWNSGVTGQLEVFAAWGFKNVYDGGEWGQIFGGVMRLDVAALDDYPETSGVIRPIPLSVITSGNYDARPHGSSPVSGALVSIGKRVNHLSHVGGPAQYTLSPDGKSVLWAHTRWARLVGSQDADVDTELQPVEAGIAYERFYHEPGWTIRRDTKEATQPVTPAWRGVSPTHCMPIETPAGLVWTGGVTTTYDGSQVVEMGYCWGPEIRVTPTSDDGIGTAGDYYYTAIPVWIDARGNAHRGPPARPVMVTLTNLQGGRVDIRCINLTMKDDRERYPTAQRIYFEVYRTTIVGGSIETEDGLYLFRSIFGGAAADFQLHDLPASDHEEFAVQIVDGAANAIVQHNELCPFQLDPDSLLWTPPPPIPHQPLNVGALWQNRLFGVDPEQGLLRWSEEILPRGADLRKPEFLDTNVLRLAGIGEVTGLVGLDNDLGILTRDGVFALAGDPGAGGSGNTFSLRVITRGYGCIEPRSVEIFDQGATFQSAKRIHVLTRGAAVEDIGAAVEDTLRVAGNVRSATFLEDRDELRFAFAAEPGTNPLAVRPRVATFNTRTGLWSIRTVPLAGAVLSASRLNEPMHACAWRGLQGEQLHVLLLQGGLLRERSSVDTSFSDEAAASSNAVRLDVTTEWLHMGLPDTTKRWPELGIITERVNAGPLTIEAWFDLDGSFDSDSGAAEHTLSIASPAPAFIRYRPRPSKARAIKLRIYEPVGAPATENVRFVAIVAHHAIKPKRQGSRNTT